MSPPTATATATATEAARRRAAATHAPARRAEPADRRPPLRVVGDEPRRRRVRRRRLAPALSLAVVVGSLLAVVVGHSLLAEGQVRLAAAQSELAAAQTANHLDTLAVGRLETPARIVGEATGSLHMVQASQTTQLPYVPLDKPLPTPAVGPAPATGTSTTGSATTGSATGTATTGTATSSPASG